MKKVFRNAVIVLTMLCGLGSVAFAENVEVSKQDLTNVKVDAPVIVADIDISDKVVKYPKYQAEFMKEAVKQGNHEAMIQLAVYYIDGYGVHQSYKKAYDLYSKLSELGDVRGDYGMAEMLYAGKGVEKNEALALELFEKAANNNHLLSMKRLSTIHFVHSLFNTKSPVKSTKMNEYELFQYWEERVKVAENKLKK